MIRFISVLLHALKLIYKTAVNILGVASEHLISDSYNKLNRQIQQDGSEKMRT